MLLHLQTRYEDCIYTIFLVYPDMKQLRFIIQQHPVRAKYGLLIIAIIMMIVAIKTYINYLNIETSIADVKNQASQIQLQKNYEQKFLVPYESSFRSDIFMTHENNILAKGEFIIQFQEPAAIAPNSTWDQDQPTLTPPKARRYFLRTIWDKQ